MASTDAPPGSGAALDPSHIRVTRNIEVPTFLSNADAAIWWAQFGLDVIPVVPGEKRSAVKWDPWLDALTPQGIRDHWAQHSDHEVGCIPGESYIVLDADSPEAEAAVVNIERRLGAESRLIVRTRRGTHRYYQLAVGTCAKSDSHSTEEHPTRIDVKVGRAMVVLPPSAGRAIQRLQASSANGLSIVGQDFVDAVALHNGRPVPRAGLAANTGVPADGQDRLPGATIWSLLHHVSADCGYDDWLRAMMAIYHATGGSAEGLDMADRWSSTGRSYSGRQEVETKWLSFRSDHGRRVTAGTLIHMARLGGADVAAIVAGDAFTATDDERVTPGPEPKRAVIAQPHALARFSLLGKLPEVEQQRVAQRPFLGDVALLGQATVIYAKPNTGKTLITLYLLIEAVKHGRVDPSRVVYINMDDNTTGLVEKLQLAEEYKFHMVADGHQGFDARIFHETIDEMIRADRVEGVVLVLDTLKKFTNTMDKAKAAGFAAVIRRLVLKGGTVVALAHTNKNPDAAGQAVYSGTTDIVEDFDAAYIVETVADKPDDNLRVVAFVNKKRRGDNALTAAYGYALERRIPYHELLLTVHQTDAETVGSLKDAAEVMADDAVIAAIAGCIGEGIATKMQLATAAAERAGCTRRAAMRVIEKYTGDDPVWHRWRFAVRARGAKVFELLAPVPRSAAT